MIKKDISKLREETISNLTQLLPVAGVKAITTSQLAQALGIKPGTVRRGFCVDGHYMGLTPVKLGNGRLLWPIHTA